MQMYRSPRLRIIKNFIERYDWLRSFIKIRKRLGNKGFFLIWHIIGQCRYHTVKYGGK